MGRREAGSRLRGVDRRVLVAMAISLAGTIFFPLALVILLVCQHKANQHAMPVGKNDDNQAELIAADIEHGALANLIRMRIRSTYVGEFAPACFADHLVPTAQWRFGSPVPFPKFAQF